MELEKRIYSPWAFKKNEDKKAEINRKIFDELVEKHTFSLVSYGKEENPEAYDVVIEYDIEYGRWEGTIIKNKPNLNTDELALLLDNGNLCFGHVVQNGRIIIFTD